MSETLADVSATATGTDSATVSVESPPPEQTDVPVVNASNTKDCSGQDGTDAAATIDAESDGVAVGRSLQVPQVPDNLILGMTKAPTEPAKSDTLMLTMQFSARKAEADLATAFLATGGPLGAAQAASTTDLALTGSEYAVTADLSNDVSTLVKIPLPESLYKVSATAPHTIEIDSRAKLIATSMRDGAAINGTIGPSVSGDGALYLSGLMRSTESIAQMPLVYGGWLEHSAVIGLGKPRVYDQHGVVYNTHFTEHAEGNAAEKAAAEMLKQYAETAWQRRQTQLVYAAAKPLTKAVVKVPVGVNDSGFSTVSAVIERRSAYSFETLEGLFKGAMSAEFSFEEDDIKQFLQDASVQGKKVAAAYGQHVAASLSTIAGSLVAYRADGRSAVTPTGVANKSAELWTAAPPRGPCVSDDCDGSAMELLSIASAVTSAEPETIRTYPFLHAVRNVLVPYYTVGTAIVGASASNAGSDAALGTANVAGHAATLLMPTHTLLRAMYSGSGRLVRGESRSGLVPVASDDVREDLACKRHAACFTADAIAGLPEDERLVLQSWQSGQNVGHPSMDPGGVALSTWQAEGTCVAGATMYLPPGKEVDKNAATSKRDIETFAKIGPTIGRSVKLLHVGGANPDSPHRFYHDIVEFSVPRTHPLWTSKAVAELGHAASQFVLVPHKHEQRGIGISAAGATPAALVTEQFAAVELVAVGSSAQELLEYAESKAAKDVMPPRHGPMQLTSFQTKQLEASLDALQNLHGTLTSRLNNAEQGQDGHNVAYVISYQGLVHNPAGVSHFCERIAACATAGIVDILEVPGMALTPTGHDAGRIVMVNASVP